MEIPNQPHTQWALAADLATVHVGAALHPQHGRTRGYRPPGPRLTISQPICLFLLKAHDEIKAWAPQSIAGGMLTSILSQSPDGTETWALTVWNMANNVLGAPL